MRGHASGHHHSVDDTLAMLWPGPASIPRTAATVVGGQTYTVKATDTAIRADSSNGTQPVIDMIAPTYIGQRWTFYWWAWATGAGQPVGPLINAPAGINMQSFAGQAVSGAAGLVTNTTITTPGATFTLEWNGTELMSM
jgi:hypothetical protein